MFQKRQIARLLLIGTVGVLSGGAGAFAQDFEGDLIEPPTPTITKNKAPLNHTREENIWEMDAGLAFKFWPTQNPCVTVNGAPNCLHLGVDPVVRIGARYGKQSGFGVRLVGFYEPSSDQRVYTEHQINSTTGKEEEIEVKKLAMVSVHRWGFEAGANWRIPVANEWLFQIGAQLGFVHNVYSIKGGASGGNVDFVVSAPVEFGIYLRPDFAITTWFISSLVTSPKIVQGSDVLWDHSVFSLIWGGGAIFGL